MGNGHGRCCSHCAGDHCVRSSSEREGMFRCPSLFTHDQRSALERRRDGTEEGFTSYQFRRTLGMPPQHYTYTSVIFTFRVIRCKNDHVNITKVQKYLRKILWSKIAR